MHTNMNAVRHAVRSALRHGSFAALALAAGCGVAGAQTPQEATTPTSVVEVGAAGVSDGSFKAGEYNGLEKKGGVGIGNFDLRGRSVYDSDNAMRWRIKGVDLGLETRSLSAEIGVQGVFRINLGYDELRRNRSDTYQTPYNGAGTNVLTLPAGWQVPTIAGSNGTNSVLNLLSARGLVKSIGDAQYIDLRTASPTFGGILKPTAAQIASVDAASNADVPAFHNVNISTKRTRYDLAVDYSFSPKWGIGGEFRPEHKDGLKLMGSVSRSTGGDISTVIPDLIDQDTNQIDLRLNYRGAKGFAQAAYYGSMFDNNVRSMSWQTWATGPTSTGTVNLGTGVGNVMSSAPSNRFNQISGTAGLTMARQTKLVASGSYARNTQNDLFLIDSTTPVVPVTSLNALVVSTALDVKLTSRPAKKLNLLAAYRYNNRDNQTPIYIFQYADAGEAPSPNANFPAGPNNPYGAVVAQNANANRAYSRKLNQLNAESDYAVADKQWIKGAYEFQRVGRECFSSWISCADAAITNENTVRAEWRTSPAADVTARVGYSYAVRRTPNYNENAFLALVPYTNVSPITATGGATAYSFMTANGWTGWGPASGFAVTTGNMNLFFPSNNALANALYANNNRISELPGLRRYYVADRDRNKLRAATTWQATAELSVQGSLDFNKDHYTDAVYGLQNTNTWAANIEGSYAVGADLTLSAFYTYEDLSAASAGNTYTANSNVATITGSQAGAIGLSGNGCDGYTTLQQRNNNNKLDPCLNWFTDRLDKVHSVGATMLAKGVMDTPLDLTASVIVSRARSDNNVTGGNWANNLLNGPGAAPTTIAAFFIAATPLPTVTTDSAELRIGAHYAITKAQALHVVYDYMRMSSADWAYEGMQFGSMQGVLPSLEQPFNYSVHVVGVSYVLMF
jgi:MtrB/PioB family decaheme-associated outer membrane protein